MKRVLALLGLAAILAWVAWSMIPALSMQGAQPIAAEPQPEVESEPIPAFLPKPHRPVANRHPTAAENGEPLWEPSPYTAEELEQDLFSVFQAVQATVMEWTPEVFFDRIRDRERMSGRDAYQIYAYLRSCMEATTDVQSLQMREEMVRSSVEDETSREYLLNQAREGLRRCEGLGGKREVLLEMLDWLVLAADRDFPQAQIAYYRSARWILSRDPMLPYAAPERVRSFRERAGSYLVAALESGHHAAFTEFALAHLEDIAFELNTVTAYAYALAAHTASQGSNARARQLMAQIEPALDKDALDHARQLSDEICQEHCR